VFANPERPPKKKKKKKKGSVNPTERGKKKCIVATRKERGGRKKGKPPATGEDVVKGGRKKEATPIRGEEKKTGRSHQQWEKGEKVERPWHNPALTCKELQDRGDDYYVKYRERGERGSRRVFQSLGKNPGNLLGDNDGRKGGIGPLKRK